MQCGCVWYRLFGVYHGAVLTRVCVPCRVRLCERGVLCGGGGVGGALVAAILVPCPLPYQVGASKEEASDKMKQEIFDSLRQKATQVNDMFHMLVHA